ncbi:MAG: MHYT domain-containing protein [Roseiflexaceae bacterium]
MSGTYDLRLVALSYLVAVFASYTALDLAGRVTSSRGRARALWLLGGSFSLGIGIWSMHFTGMLAFVLPMATSYDLPLVLLSLLVAVLASAGALVVMSRPTARARHLLVGGPLVGAGIAAMHYTGMAAMRMEATISYDPLLLALSIAIAIGAAMAALWLAFQFRADYDPTRRWQGLKFASALVMAIAITGMHYTGMAAARFTALAVPMSHASALSPLPLGVAIVGATLVILGFTLLSALFDRRFAAQSITLAESAQRHLSLFQYNSDAVFAYDLTGALLDANQAAIRITGASLEELRRNGLRALLAAEDGVRMADHMQAAVSGATQEYDLMLARGGDSVRLNLRNVPILIDGRVVGVYAIATDITERARAVAALRDNQAELRALVERQHGLLEIIREISTPVLPVHDRVLLLPLVGQLDAERGKQLTATLLAGVERHRASVVIIDITGVPLIDTAVASHLLQATVAANLLGAESVLVGVSPEVAQTLVQLGIDFGKLTTRSNLQAGVAYAVARQSQSASAARHEALSSY